MKNVKVLIDSFGMERFKEDEPLKYHTYLKTGGLAKLFFVAFKESEIVKIITSCRQLNIPFLFFGTGSKMLFADDGFDGVVIQNKGKNIEIVSIKGKVSKSGVGVEQAIIEADSGVTISQLAKYLKEHGLLSDAFEGVVGSLGGSLFMYKPLQEKVEKVKILDEAGTIETITPTLLNLRKHIILSLTLRIKAQGEI